jgi:hypothetical protein
MDWSSIGSGAGLTVIVGLIGYVGKLLKNNKLSIRCGSDKEGVSVFAIIIAARGEKLPHIAYSDSDSSSSDDIKLDIKDVSSEELVRAVSALQRKFRNNKSKPKS